MKGENISDSGWHDVCFCVFVALNPAVYNYLFLMQSKRLQLWWKDVYPPPNTVFCAPQHTFFFFCCPARSSPLVAFESKQWGDFYFLDASPLLGPGTSQRHLHNICFELDGMWCVSHRRLDEPWVPPGSNCPHHQSDCELTNSADPQLMEWLRQNGRARGDDGIIRYLCLLLCLVQRGVAHNSSSWYSVCHLLHYKGL